MADERGQAKAASTAGQSFSHRQFWLTTGLVTILGALIGVGGTLLAAGRDRGEPPSPATAGSRSGDPSTDDPATGSPSTGSGAQPPRQGPDGYVVRYENVRLTLPHPEGICFDSTVTFDLARPTVQTGQTATANDSGYDLVYSNCNGATETRLIVPGHDRSFALVEGTPPVTECAEAANLRQGAPRQMLARSIEAGATYCMTAGEKGLVRFTIVSVEPSYNLVIEATAWRKR